MVSIAFTLSIHCSLINSLIIFHNVLIPFHILFYNVPSPHLKVIICLVGFVLFSFLSFFFCFAMSFFSIFVFNVMSIYNFFWFCIFFVVLQKKIKNLDSTSCFALFYACFARILHYFVVIFFNIIFILIFILFYCIL